ARHASRRESRCSDESCSLQLAYAAAIDNTPPAAGPARREALRKTLVIECVTHAIDPAEAQRFVERFAIGHAALARMHFVQARVHLRHARVIALEPRTKLLARCEALRLVSPCRHGAQYRSNAGRSPCPSFQIRASARPWCTPLPCA